MGFHVWWHDHGAGEAQYAHHSFFFSPGQFVVFVAGLIAAGMTIDLAGFLPCTSLSALSAPVALTRTGVEAPVAQAKAALADLPEKFPQWILGESLPQPSARHGPCPSQAATSSLSKIFQERKLSRRT